MNKLKSIIPDILFFRFSNDLWHILRAHGFGVAIQNGCSAIISVDESIICTMDVLGRITPDETFRKEAPEALNRHLDRLIYLYLSTLYTCLNRRPMIRLCIPVEEDTIDLLGQMILFYCPSKDEADPNAAPEPTESEAGSECPREASGQCSGLHFHAPDDDTKIWPDVAVKIQATQPRHSPLNAVLATGGLAVLAALLFRKHR